LELLRRLERARRVRRDEGAQASVQTVDPRQAVLRGLDRRDLALPDRAREMLDGPVVHSCSSAACSSAAMKRDGSSASARSPAARSMAAARWARSTLSVRDSVMSMASFLLLPRAYYAPARRRNLSSPWDRAGRADRRPPG